MKLFLGIIFSGLMVIPVFSYANQIVRCDGCTIAQKQNLASQWGVANIPRTSKEIKFFHVVDLQAENAVTFKLSRYSTRPTHSAVIAAQVATDSDIQSKTARLSGEIRQLKQLTESVVIPTSVIKGAWEFTNCAYCANHIDLYIKSHVGTTAQNVALTIETLATSLGFLQTPLPNTYRVNLESGGYIYVKLTITGDATIFLTVETVVDENGNTVPLSSNEMKDKRVYLATPGSGVKINNFINPIGYSVPTQRTGTVTIEQCTQETPLSPYICK